MWQPIARDMAAMFKKSSGASFLLLTACIFWVACGPLAFANFSHDPRGARTNNSLSDGNNTFSNVAWNVYGGRVTNILTVNLSQSMALQFDASGNQTNDGTRSFFFNAENQLTNITVAGAWRTEFVYDGL